MKRIFITLLTCCIIANSVMAQFQRTQKTAMPVSKPVMVKELKLAPGTMGKPAKF